MTRRLPVEWGFGVVAGVAAFLAVRGVDPLPLVLVAALAGGLLLTPAGKRALSTISRRQRKPSTSPEVHFDDIGGQEAAKRELREAVDFLRHPAAASALGIRALHGVLLAGPPGTGKTLLAKAAAHRRSDVADAELVVGLDDPAAPFAHALRRLTAGIGGRLVEPEEGSGTLTHAELAARGAQVLVSWCPAGEAPRGFAVCPVVAVAADDDELAAMPDDFDLSGGASPDVVAGEVLDLVRSVFCGEQSASERRGAREFELRRLTRSM